MNDELRRALVQCNSLNASIRQQQEQEPLMNKTVHKYDDSEDFWVDPFTDESAEHAEIRAIMVKVEEYLTERCPEMVPKKKKRGRKPKRTV